MDRESHFENLWPDTCKCRLSEPLLNSIYSFTSRSLTIEVAVLLLWSLLDGPYDWLHVNVSVSESLRIERLEVRSFCGGKSRNTQGKSVLLWEKKTWLLLFICRCCNEIQHRYSRLLTVVKKVLLRFLYFFLFFVCYCTFFFSVSSDADVIVTSSSTCKQVLSELIESATRVRVKIA